MRECMAETDLSPEEVKRLEDLPDAAHEVKNPLGCELEGGHVGPHVALAQSDDRGFDDSTNWWLRWTDGSREWAHDPSCEAERPGTVLLCLLPDGHEGEHVWL